MRTTAEHDRAVGELVRQFAALEPDAPVRLAKRTSNLFRPRAAAGTGLDVSALDDVVAVDEQRRTARVQGMATYEQVVAATLPQGLMPLVVPQLKTITVGGAVTGLGIESSSFRNGMPHESVLEMDVLTGSGQVVTAGPRGEHDELFRCFPNSYGSLGYAVALTIELEPVHPFVRLRHVRFGDVAALVDTLGSILATGSWDGAAVDFLDGVVFARDEAYLTIGTWADALDAAERPSDYTGQHIYYRSIQHRPRDVLTVHDYLWRWDTDWFWCSRGVGAQHPIARRLWPRRWLRSDVYWKLVGFELRHHVKARIDARRGLPERERVVQDVELPLGSTEEYLDWFLRTVPITPVWLCPVRLRSHQPAAGAGRPRTAAHESAIAVSGVDDDVPWPLYPMRRGTEYVNMGFWSTVPMAPGAAEGDVNRAVERVVSELGGHKSLYSDAYYERDAFLAKYGGAAYERVKSRYDRQGRFPDLYDKVVKRR